MFKITSQSSSDDEEDNVHTKTVILKYKESKRVLEEKKKLEMQESIFEAKKITREIKGQQDVVQRVFVAKGKENPTYHRSKKSILVNENQKQNPLLKEISKDIQLIFRTDILPHFIISENICVFCLSMRYYLNHPNYLQQKFQAIESSWTQRIIIVEDDLHLQQRSSNDGLFSKTTKDFHDDHERKQILENLGIFSIHNQATLFVSFSRLETARYLELFARYHDKSPRILKEKMPTNYLPRITNVLTQVGPINKTDVKTLLKNFGSFKNIVNANQAKYNLCHGFGKKKSENLHAVFHCKFT